MPTSIRSTIATIVSTTVGRLPVPADRIASWGRLERTVRSGVGEVQEEALRSMAADELDGLVAEHVGQVPPVRGEGQAVALEIPLPVVLEATAKSDELGEAAAVRVVVDAERAAVPLADETGDVARLAEQVTERALTERDAIRAAVRERVDHAAALRIAPGEERRPGRRADRRGRVVLGQDGAVGGQRVDRRASVLRRS